LCPMTMKPPSTNSTRERMRARDDKDGSMTVEASDSSDLTRQR
jgi:hypothetical protein